MAGIKRYSVAHPEWLQVKKDGNFSYGYNQDWYRDDWKQLAGCGPTTAAQAISYLEFKVGALDTNQHEDGEAALARMDEVWEYVRPRYGGGLYKSRWWKDGVEHYLSDHKLPFKVERLPIYPLCGSDYSLEDVTEFIRKGLESDAVVGFLNRHRGVEEELYTWHWVPIIRMEVSTDDVRCVVYDDSIERKFSLKRWLAHNLLGGGFLYITDKGDK